MEKLIPKHGGYRNLKSFQIARLVYDITKRFCDRNISKFSRTHDQMVQAARSGVQNIAEGSKASGTSKKTELKLTNVARASLEELLLDYEDFLRQNKLPIWEFSDPKRKHLVSMRFQTADQVAMWVKEVHQKSNLPLQEVSANAVITLITVAINLLSKQVQSLADSFQKEGGFTERLYRLRKKSRQRF